MNTTTVKQARKDPSKLSPYVNRVIHGDCIQVMRKMPKGSIDLVVTDPPYMVNYRPHDGRTLLNDDNSNWLKPAFSEIYRVLRPDSFCVCFYGWANAEKFMSTWKAIGFSPQSHFVWVKKYSSKVGYTRSHHALAYLLVKGRPKPPQNPPRDVLPWQYTGNTLHPTQKPVLAMLPLIDAYSKPEDIVLDPFAGSGTVAVASSQSQRKFIAIEKSWLYFQTAQRRLQTHLNHKWAA